jgi:glycosyltransferase involved in cell wall biosynthesis
MTVHAGPKASLAVLDANFRWTRSLFSPLAALAPTLFLSPKDLRTARSSGWRARQLFRSRELSPSLWETRYAFPPGWFSVLSSPFMAFLALELRRWWSRIGHSRRILVLSYPQYLPVLRRSRPTVTVYYWSDNFQMYWPDRAERTTGLENEIVRRADLTICASKAKANELSQSLPGCSDRIRYVVHGHQPALLANEPSRTPKPLPPDLAHFRRPVLGHWGQVSDNLDFEVVRLLADRFPAASIVFVGPVDENFTGPNAEIYQTCRTRPNVHFVGTRPYASAPDYIPAFDVCLALYRPELAFTRVTNPSKIRDYLATSRPIVTTALPDAVELWPGLMKIARDPEEYVRHVESIIETGGNEAAGLRLEYARQHVWARCSERVWQMIEAI